MTPDPQEPLTRDVAARGARIRFVEAGHGPPLVLVHDYLSSHVAWDDVLPRLAQRFRVVVPDLPGFGDSEKPPPGRYRYGFDGFSECWFRDEAQFLAAVQSDTWAEAVADGENFLDYSGLWGAVLDERIVREGDRDFVEASG